MLIDAPGPLLSLKVQLMPPRRRGDLYKHLAGTHPDGFRYTGNRRTRQFRPGIPGACFLQAGPDSKTVDQFPEDGPNRAW